MTVQCPVTVTEKKINLSLSNNGQVDLSTTVQRDL